MSAPENAPNLLVAANDVIDITGFVKDGKLIWQAPAGNWTIMHYFMRPTGTMNSPASRAAQGPEIDKLTKEIAQFHFDAYIGQFLKTMPVKDRTALKYAVVDSYEKGAQNWTDGFAEKFEQRYGYDPIPFLPVYSGRAVNSVDQSERFLWDVRRLVADSVAYEYTAGLRERAHQNGLKLWLENYGHWGFPAEFLQYGGQADIVSGEFWASGDLGAIELKAASSAAHIYGQKTVMSESFTSGRDTSFKNHPWNFKKRGDWSFVEGINHTLLHVYIHQAYDDRFPGVNAWFGSEFNRNNTWFNFMGSWLDYIKRANYMMQQAQYGKGHVIYHTPTPQNAVELTQVLAKTLTDIGAPADVSGLPEHVLWSHRSGNTHDIYFIANQSEQTVTIEPSFRVSSHYGALSHMQPQRFDAVTGDIYDVAQFNNKVGRIHIPMVLKGLESSFIVFEKPLSLAGKVMNTSVIDIDTHPEKVSIKQISENGEPIHVSSRFDATGSRMVGVTKNGQYRIINTDGSSQTITVSDIPSVMTLTEPWQLTFQESCDVPTRLTLSKLTSLTALSPVALKYYSGTIMYQTTFDIDKSMLRGDQQLQLGLGEVGVIARVTLNNKALGELWSRPLTVNIIDAVKAGTNTLTVEVATTWINRLIGDLAHPKQFPDKAKPKAFNADITFDIKMSKSDVLQPSGLIGPVTIKLIRKLVIQAQK